MEKSQSLKIKKNINYNRRSKSTIFDDYTVPVSGKKRSNSVENLKEHAGGKKNDLNIDEIKSFYIHKKQ